MDVDLRSVYSAFLAYVLVRDAIRLSPKLLLQMQQSGHSTSLSIVYHETGPFPAVYDSSLNITEEHRIFGNSTNDFVLTNYTEVEGMKFPQTVQLMYNQNSLILQSLRDTIIVNPSFPDDFFTGLPTSQINQTYSLLPPAAPESSTEFGTAEVFENK
jgi:hypothetical protein